MKRFFHIVNTGAVILLLLSACQIDNYKAPKATLTGKVVYKGQPVGVRSNAVELELWQPGYQLKDYIPVYISQDGTFSARLFNGKYKLVTKQGNGPWVNNPDTMRFDMEGSKSMNVSVTPYFTIQNLQFSKTDTTINATFNLNQVVQSQSLDNVTLFVGKTHFVDKVYNIDKVVKPASDISNLSQPVSLDFSLANAPQDKDSIYVRVGVKTSGVEDMLYSPVKEMPVK